MASSAIVLIRAFETMAQWLYNDATRSKNIACSREQGFLFLKEMNIFSLIQAFAPNSLLKGDHTPSPVGHSALVYINDFDKGFSSKELSKLSQ